VALAHGLRTLATTRHPLLQPGDEPPTVTSWLTQPFQLGSVAKVTYRSRGGHPFSGLFADDEVPGFVRLSLISAPTAHSYAPTVTLRLLIRGGRTATAGFVNRAGLDGQQPDQNFFRTEFSTQIPTPRSPLLRAATTALRAVSHGDPLRTSLFEMSGVNSQGESPSPRGWEQRTPFELVLRPVPGLETPMLSVRDFRDELGDIALGPMFEVHGRQDHSPLEHIGDLTLTSRFVASRYGDEAFPKRLVRARPLGADLRWRVHGGGL
jgi:hypothetical protein